MKITSLFHRLFQKKRKPQTAASERGYAWFPLCPPCYAVRYPGREPWFAGDKREICRGCGRHTLTGTYVRMAVKEETKAA